MSLTADKGGIAQSVSVTGSGAVGIGIIAGSTVNIGSPVTAASAPATKQGAGPRIL